MHSNKTDAHEICRAWQRAEDMAGRGDATEQQIRKVLSETLERIGSAPLESPTVREWLNRWVESKDSIVSPATMQGYRQAARDFLDFLGKRADSKLETVTPESVTAFRDYLRTQGLSSGTIRKLIKKFLNSPFNHAWRSGKIASNPISFVEIESKRDRKSGKSPRQTFTPAQVKKMLKASPDDDWHGLILVAYFTGARLQDAANLTVKNLDMKAGAITFTQRKTGDDVQVPLHASVKAWMKKHAPKAGPLFPTLANRDEGGRNGLSKQFQRIMEAAAIVNTVVREKPEEGRGRSVNALTFHSLRHSFNTALTNAGVPPELRQLLTGHADEKSNRRYTHDALPRLREAMEKLPGL